MKFHYTLLLFLSSTLILLTFASRPEFDYDLFWHLNAGRDIVDFHTSPYVDSHSYTYAGKKITSLPWLFEVIAYSFYKHLGGMLGIQILKGVIWTIAVAGVLAFAGYKALSLGWTCYLLALVLYGHGIKFFLRPDTFTLAIFPLFLILIYEIKKDWKWANIFLLSATLGLLTNWHLSSALLYLVVLAAFTERIIEFRQSKPSSIKIALAQLTIVLLSGFLNPSFSHPLTTTLLFNPEWSSLITEHASPTWDDYTATATGFFFLCSISAVYSIYRKRLFEFFCLIGLGVKAFSVVRMINIDIILLAPITAYILRDLLSEFSKWEIRKTLSRAFVGAITFVCISASWTLFSAYASTQASTLPSPSLLPFNLVSEGRNLILEGRVLNSLPIGGWLSFYFPGLKVHIDGRTNILYPIEHLRSFPAVKNTEALTKEALRELKIDFVFGKFDFKENYLRHAVFSEDFHVQWMSHHYLLLSRNEPHSEFLTRTLFKPHCFDQVSDSILEKDIAGVLHLFGGQSDMYITLSKAKELRKIDDYSDLKRFINENENLLSDSDYLSRIVARMLKKQNHLREALQMQMEVKSFWPMDMLFSIELAQELRDPRLLYNVIHSPPPALWLYPFEIDAVLTAIEELNSLPDGPKIEKEISESYKSEYRSQLQRIQYSNSCKK